MLDLGNLRIGVTLDDKEAKRGLKELEGNAEDFSSVAETAFTVAAAAAAALGVALAGVTKSSLDAYASYEQLVGGVGVIFGDTAAEVEKYAGEAYKTMGISANEYMQQVTGFSSSLLQSLNGDTEAAARTANMALQDMSDNASVFGTDIESIQRAYQGFARGQYGMLDNLRLGYQGSRDEMERLLTDAEAISGVHYDISNYADVISAIHVVQTEMGVTGNAAREASKTIEGSVNQAKAAYANWLVGLADDNADIEQLTTDLVDSVVTAAENLVPRVLQIVHSLVEQIPAVIDQIKADIPNLIEEIFPEDTANVINGVLSALDSLLPVLGALAAAIIAVGAALKIQQAISGVVAAFQGMFALFAANPILLVVAAVAALAVGLVELYNNSEEFRNMVAPALDAVKQGFDHLSEAFGQLLTALQPVADTFTNNVLPVLETIASVVGTILVGAFGMIVEVLATVVGAIANFISIVVSIPEQISVVGQGIADFITNVGNFFAQLPGIIGGFLSSVISTVISWVSNMVSNAIQAGSQFISNIVSFFTSLPGRIGAYLSAVITRVVVFVGNLIGKAREAGSKFVSNLTSLISGLPDTFLSIGSDIVSGMLSGITGAWDGLVSKVKGMLSGLPDAVKQFLGIASPSKMFAEIGRFTIEGFEVGFSSGVGDAVKTAVQAAKDISIGFEPVAQDMTVGYRSYQDTTAAAANNQTINNNYIFEGMTFNDLEQMRNVTIDELINLYHIYGRNAA